MHPFIPRNPNPLDVASQAERMARQEQGRWGLVFQAITAVSLAVVTSKMLLDMLRDIESQAEAASPDQPAHADVIEQLKAKLRRLAEDYDQSKPE